MPRNNVIKNLFYIAVLSTVVVLTWIGTSVYYSLVTPTVPEDTSKYTQPITPAFDTSLLNQLGSRVQVPVDLSADNNTIFDPNPEEEATGSARPTPTTPVEEDEDPILEIDNPDSSPSAETSSVQLPDASQ